MSSPFDEAKYRALLDGLETSEITLSSIKNENPLFRIDSEYYQSVYVDIEEMLGKNGFTYFESHCSYIKKGIFDLPPTFYQEKGIPLIRTSEIKSPVIDFSTTVFIDEDIQEENVKTKLHPFDLVFTKIGAYIGDVALLPPTFNEYNFSQNVAGASIINKTESAYLLAFFLSKYGKSQILQSQMLSGQGKLELSTIKKYKIANASEKIKLLLNQVLNKSFKISELSKSLYAEAEALLLSELGLKDWQPSEANTAEVSLVDSFLSSGRLDAEYYQPKYEEIEEKIKSYYNGYCVLGETINYVYTGEYSEEYLPKANNLKFYIRSTNIKLGQIEEDEAYYVEPNKFSKVVKEGDIITARVGTIGVFGCVSSEFEGSVYSDNVLCFKLPSYFNPSVYTLYFNTKVNWELVDRLARGSVQQRLNQETLKELIIPIIEKPSQDKISLLIEQSQNAQAKSKRLLTLAKEAVEVAIEQNEEAAEKLISSSLADLE